MTREKVDELFEKHNEEYLMTARLPPGIKPHDLRALAILGKYCANGVLACAEHDEVFLGVDAEEFAEHSSEEEIVELIRCGVMSTRDGFKMFV